MKSIYKLMILGMLYLVSNTTCAQLYQYSEDGTKSCIECDKTEGGEHPFWHLPGLFFFPGDLATWPRIIPSYNPERENWLRHQELMMAERLCNCNLDFYTDWDFNNYQRNYFRNLYLGDIKDIYLPSIETEFENRAGYDADKLRKAEAAFPVLYHRLQVGTGENARYGDLKYNGQYLRDIPNYDLIYMLTGEERTRDEQRAARNNDLRYDAYYKHIKDNPEILAAYLADQMVGHYNSLDYEPAARWMATVIMGHAGYDNSHVLDNIWDVRDHNYLEDLIDITLEQEVSYNQVQFEDLPLDEALFRHALYNEFTNQSENFVRTNANVRSEFKKYMQHHEYSRESLDLADELSAKFSSDTPFPHNEQNYKDDGLLLFQDETRKNLLYNVGKTKVANSKLYGLTNLIESYRQVENHDPAIIGEFIREIALRQFFNFPNYFTKTEIGLLFEFETVNAYDSGPDYYLEVSFRNNLGTITWDEGVDFHHHIDRPYVAEGFRSILNGESFDFAFKRMVYELSNTLNLSEAQENWLVGNRDETEALYTFWAENNNEQGRNFSREALEVLRNGGEVDFFDEVILDSSFLETNAYCVYSELKARNGNLFRQTIGSFIDDPKYKLYFRVGECDTTDQACTDAKDIDNTNSITIILENVNISSLNAAALILHEGIHAELYRFVDQAHNEEVDPNDRKLLFDLYENYKGSEWQDANAQHNYMTTKYVEPIAKAIRALDNNQYPLEYYMGFGWDGLRAYDYQGILSNEESDELYELQAIVNQNTTFNPQNCN